MKLCFVLILVPAILLLVTAAECAPVRLALQFQIGQVSKMSITMDMKESYTSDSIRAAQEQHTTMQVELVHRVIASDETGTNVELRFERLAVSVPVSGKTITFDTTRDKVVEDNPLNALSAIVGETVALRLLPNGRVDKLDGVDDILKKVSARNRGALAVEITQRLLGDRQIRHTFNEGFAAALPGNPVNVGDKWRSLFTQDDHGTQFSTTSRYSLASVDQDNGRTVAKIEFTTDGTIGGNAPRGGKIMDGRLHESGTKRFDVSRGCFQQTDREQVMSGEIVLPGTDGNHPLKFEQTKTSTISIRPLK